MGALRPFFIMQRKTRILTQGAILAALYILLSLLQNLLLPGSASMPIQLRISEALCVLAFFTPAAVSGLTLGCLIFNLAAGGALPLDFLVGSLATLLATGAMRKCRRFPVPALLFPPLCNGLLVGWELSVTIGGGFWLNAAYVAAGEALAMLFLGLPLYGALKGRKLPENLFP